MFTTLRFPRRVLSKIFHFLVCEYYMRQPKTMSWTYDSEKHMNFAYGVVKKKLPRKKWPMIKKYGPLGSQGFWVLGVGGVNFFWTRDNGGVLERLKGYQWTGTWTGGE